MTNNLLVCRHRAHVFESFSYHLIKKSSETKNLYAALSKVVRNP